MINAFEETLLKNQSLPKDWQSQDALDELSDFLQQNWEQRFVFYDDEEISSRQQFLGFAPHGGIRTHDYVGTISFKGEQLNIFPKVFRSEANDNDVSDLDVKHLMKNLVQWLEYCSKMEYPYIHLTSELEDSEDLRELFISLYVRYVKLALDRGFFYRYEEIISEERVIKGRLDIKDYLTKKVTNGQLDRFNCGYSNFEFDNTLNRIIKYTCKILLNETSKNNQRIIRHILMKLNDVTDTRCMPHDCDSVKLSRFHTHYTIVLSMSKMFLLNKVSTSNLDNAESFCFLFPTDLLFEGFIGGFMQSVLKEEAKVRLQACEVTLIDNIKYAGQSFGKAFTMKHDILVEHKDKGVFILDTKYKKLDRFEGNPDVKALITQEVKQDDLYQVIEYAAHRELKDVYLLYPMFRYEAMEPYFPEMTRKTINGNNVIYVHLIRLPFVFEEDVAKTKESLAEVINSIFN